MLARINQVYAPAQPPAAQFFLPPPVQQSASEGLFPTLLKLAGIGAGFWLGYRVLESTFSRPACDTYKYVFKQGSRLHHGGITNNLSRREREHRRNWPGGQIKQVGRRTTRSAALAWERRMGFWRRAHPNWLGSVHAVL